ncbi:ribonuclease domain-containing protein [Azospira sp. APE16]|jgi:ribonuclease T1|uniref:ribonuclease domain-containing protein n=1 Tax=unclassified Azospira TaxID=2609269 RepID=UPI0011F9580E|nr:ribonuclease domain-containing protein [Azospira sp.]MDK9692307.1 ribonuclease N1 [Azospira sp.]TLS18343.1 MAG: ribonuclease N1 [Betaproteobacteria bacterium]
MRRSRLLPSLLAGLALLGGLLAGPAAAREPNPGPAFGDASVSVQELPAEARSTLNLIHRGGPFPYPKDGSTFGNFERRLPLQPRGYYREYTVDTPGARNRGARRLIAGGQPPVVFYYTDDHYRSFRRLRD